MQKKGYTVIELLVVLMIMGVLVLCVVWGVLRYQDRLKITKIQADIFSITTAMHHKLRNDGDLHKYSGLSSKEVAEVKTKNGLYSKQGVVDNKSNIGLMYKVPLDVVQEVKSTLGGTFMLNKDGYIYYAENLNPFKESDIFDKPVQVIVDNTEKEGLEVSSWIVPRGLYQVGGILRGGVQIKGEGAEQLTVLMSLVHCKTGKETTVSSTEFSSTLGILEYMVTYGYTEKDRVGLYDVYLTIRKGSQTVGQVFVPRALCLVSSEWEYYYGDDFSIAEQDIIGQVGKLGKDFVKLGYKYDEEKGVDYGTVNIDIVPQNPMTAQVYTKLPITYGTYEVCMKVPQTEGLLSSFFLFGVSSEGVPSEVDIEVMKYKGNWQVWCTLHNINGVLEGLHEGEEYQTKQEMKVNPTSNFLVYRIEYYPRYIRFYVEGEKIGEWLGTMYAQELRLFAGTFYTHWLYNGLTQVPDKMQVEWVRKKYLEEN